MAERIFAEPIGDREFGIRVRSPDTSFYYTLKINRSNRYKATEWYETVTKRLREIKTVDFPDYEAGIDWVIDSMSGRLEDVDRNNNENTRVNKALLDSFQSKLKSRNSIRSRIGLGS